ncbi:MAG: 2-dehydropantoate 2-reductase [Candidatus Thermoplasmatota archaeon]|nr:2-dehydropantoate 2-reductase [Candidatus Thermoplasmatota archaeon]
MNIVIYGAGAIGSLIGAKLSRNNNVFLIGRKPHIDVIRSKGLNITGKTKFTQTLQASDSVSDVTFNVDLLILTVKSYDTLDAMIQARPLVSKDTMVLTLQNGLDNIEKIKTVVPKEQILAAITTHGVVFKEPGKIHHTGFGRTILGELDGKNTQRLDTLTDLFNKANIPTIKSNDILRDIWLKGIVNSSINPLTALFTCRNGYLKENPILYHLVLCLCEESVTVARCIGYQFTAKELAEQTFQVIDETAENYSSMLQSIIRGSRTEIDSINGIIVANGKKNHISVMLNEIVCNLIKQLHT